jgi:hypothetical protein
LRRFKILRRKFAVIKLWPGQKAAEDEIIERLKIAAQLLGLECLVVDSYACLLHPPYTQLTQDDVDFVLSLHFETPKRYDIFSFVTLWNPLQFYYEWGYRKFTRHLLTHDDFLSCDSASGDDHVMRSISSHAPRHGPLFRFFPSLSGPLLEPTLGEKKLFYAGMNWEKSSKRPGRHDGLLGLLDDGGDLRIYGPKIYGGVDVWQGFKSYLGPIAFDGVSVVRLINQAGISLVLSSQAHVRSEMMSSRIFESSAAGAVIICNENAFARRHFGDALLYIDTTLPPQETFFQVQSHLAWIKAEPKKALGLAKLAQNIFREKFRLDTCLERIYDGLPARKAQVASVYTPKRSDERICVVFLMPEFRTEILEQHIASYQAQKNVYIRGVLAMDAQDVELFGPRAKCRLNAAQAPMEIVPLNFMDRRPDRSVIGRRPAGESISEILRSVVNKEIYVCIVAPEERLFSDHLSSLLGTLQDSPGVECAWADMLQSRNVSGDPGTDLCDDPEVNNSECGKPLGFGRFLFRMSAVEDRIHTALPYLNNRAIDLLFGAVRSTPTRRCTLITAQRDRTPGLDNQATLELEREILIDFDPDAFRVKHVVQVSQPQQTEPNEHVPSSPIALSLANLTEEERTRLAVELAHSVPFPAVLKRMAFGAYRLWFRLAGSRTTAGT